MQLQNGQNESVYSNVKNILVSAREKAYSAVNFAMVEAYWNVGKMIIEAQDGNERSEYGDYLIKFLSEKLTEEFGKGFNIANLKNMRQFYCRFPNSYALRSQLSWTHYRFLMRIDKEEVRICVEGERSFMRRLNGGCHTSLGAYASLQGEIMNIIGIFQVGERLIKKDISGSKWDYIKLGKELAEKILRG